MIVTALSAKGNSSKFQVVTKRGEFVVALSFTLRTKIWQLADAPEELRVATELAEAIVSRHDPAQPFRSIYVFAEHNSPPTYTASLAQLRKYGYGN
jgi:hypothetical protein